jgi:prophage regulatory protein
VEVYIAMNVLRFKQLKTEKGIPFSRQHIKRLERDGKFPRSVPFGANTEVYVEEEVDRWKAERVAMRDARAAALANQKIKETA